MNKFKIACDMDGVLNDLIEKTTALYNKRFGKDLSSNDFEEYEIHKCIPFDDAEKFCALFHEKELWDSLEPLEYSQWGLKRFIDNGYEVYLATATAAENFPWKLDWIKKFFPFIEEKNVILIHNKGLLNVDVLIDDNIANLLSSISYYRVCYDQPWNRKCRDEAYGIRRARNWNEVVAAVEKIYEFENS